MSDVHDVLGALDLNLLRSLDALLTERHVTRAAARLGVTQSAASHALARLREEVGDLLLVRGPGGSLLPTPRAEQLGPVVRRALSDIAAAWREQEFVPGSARRTFTIGAGDFAELVLLPALAARLAATAPSVDLFVRVVPPEATAALASGQLDVVLAPTRDLGSGCFQRHLLDEVFTVAMRGGHARRHRQAHAGPVLRAGSPADRAARQPRRLRRRRAGQGRAQAAGGGDGPALLDRAARGGRHRAGDDGGIASGHGLRQEPRPRHPAAAAGAPRLRHQPHLARAHAERSGAALVPRADHRLRGRSRARGGARPLPPDALPELAQ
jgi:DNA-binding transcriptional LysR family regulator